MPRDEGDVYKRQFLMRELMLRVKALLRRTYAIAAEEQGAETVSYTHLDVYKRQVLDGTGRFTVGGEVFILSEGETLLMPKNIPHAVYGEERFKMQLIVSF